MNSSRTLRHGWWLGCAVLLTLLAAPAQAQYEPKWESLDKRPTPTWFLDAKFGIFIHWGVYSVPGWGAPKQYAEWYWHNMLTKNPKKPTNEWREFHVKNYGENFDYKDFAPQFRAELFNADQWADIFARSGAKYIVPTSKHHEGFCLWPNEQASKAYGRPWNSMEIGPKRDLMGELAGAVRKRDIKFGFYYSLYEWYNPLWQSDKKRFVEEHLFPQFKDVVTRYQPAIIFSDGEWDLHSKDWRSEELLAWLFNEAACKNEVVINDRWGKDSRHKHGGYYTTEYAAGLKDDSHPWEESRGMAYSYGYNRAEALGDYKTAREFIFILCDLVSRGGNFLLDIGPTADGRIPVIMQQRLIELGDWLKVNGEAIYGSRYSGRACQWSDGKRPGQQYGEYMIKYDLMAQAGQKPKNDLAVKQIFFTKKPGALYAITTGWPGKELFVRDITVPANSEITLLGVDQKLKYQVQGTTLTLETPALGPEEAPCHHAFTFKITGAEVVKENK
ncbi:MAG: alpha-L-fucosidase [Verrucomicrobiota bacterium]